MAAQEAPLPLRWRYGDVGDSNFALHGRGGVPLLVGLLLLILFLVVLCLYLRWACSRRTPGPAAVAASSPPAARLPAGLDVEAIASLPVALYRPPASPAGEEAQCSICISCLVDGEKVKVLPACGHCFHPECVDAWLRSQPSCPLCRGSLLAATKPQVGHEAV